MRKRRITKVEFSKKLITGIVSFSAIMIVWSYILLSLGIEISDAVIIAWISGVIVEALGYGFKAYFGKKNEENTKLERDRLGLIEEDEQ